MSELKELESLLAQGKITRRDFLARLSALGIAAALSPTLLTTTARAAKRAKEVGMRKILGAGRISLMLQFMAEAILFSLIALFFSIVLVEIVLKLTPINALLNKPLIFDLSSDCTLKTIKILLIKNRMVLPFILHKLDKLAKII